VRATEDAQAQAVSKLEAAADAAAAAAAEAASKLVEAAAAATAQAEKAMEATTRLMEATAEVEAGQEQVALLQAACEAAAAAAAAVEAEKEEAAKRSALMEGDLQAFLATAGGDDAMMRRLVATIAERDAARRQLGELDAAKQALATEKAAHAESQVREREARVCRGSEGSRRCHHERGGERERERGRERERERERERGREREREARVCVGGSEGSRRLQAVHIARILLRTGRGTTPTCPVLSPKGRG
jgi:hypothetical protein